MKAIFVLGLSLFLTSCADNRIAGGTTETGNARIGGQLAYIDGAPASGAQIYLRPKNYLPNISAKVAVNAAFRTLDSTQTDSLGNFAFDSIAAGTYMLECLDGENGNGALIDSVVIDNSDTTTQLAPDTLKPLGGMTGRIEIPNSGNLSEIRVLIYGLDRFAVPDSSGQFTVPGLPEGKYDIHIAGPGISVDLRGDRGAEVFAGQTTILPDSLLSLTDTSLVGYWTFDENSGQMAYDASGNGNTGVLGNTASADFSDPVWALGKIGSCLQFDSVHDSRVVVDAVTSSLDSLIAFTYTVWINPTEHGTRYSRILSREITPYKFDDFFLCVDGWKGLGVGLADVNDSIYGANSDSNMVQLNVWQHIAVTYDDSGDKTAHIFINGVVAAYFTPPETLAAPLRLTSNPLTIGNILKDEQRPFIGKIDEVKVYNRVLTQSEILAEMNRQ